MEPIELEPKYSPRDTFGQCIKCLAEQKMNACLKELLTGQVNNPKCEQIYEALVTFLRSPESDRLRIESECYLAEGKNVIVRISYIDGKPKYELIIKD